MKIEKQLGHQGDTQWFKIDVIPKNAKKIKKQFLASSEQSGSFHALFGDYEQYEIENGFLLNVKQECILNHSLKKHLNETSMEIKKILPKKDHRHSIIPKGLYFVGIQERFDPLSAMKIKVKD